MAIRRLHNFSFKELDEDVIRQISDEMSSGAESVPGAPRIFMEVSGREFDSRGYTHWFVVWDGFADMDDETRTRTVMAAIRRSQGDDEAERVVWGVGLTADEAVGFGLPIDGG